MEEKLEENGAGVDDVEWWTSGKARVFISCGQKPGEESRAQKIRDAVRELGFAPYLAIDVHSPQAITQGIYQKLTTADYYLFVGFARELIGGSTGSRGSLFTDQELGIASYLDIESLPFLERGVKLEGILKYIQGNPVWFDSEPDLIAKIPYEIARAGWLPANRRELLIERDEREVNHAVVPQTDLATGRQVWVPVRYYHLGLRNLHWRLLATNCIVHAVGITDTQSGVTVRPDRVEFKFKHVTSPFVALPPDSRREFDAVIVPEPNPSTCILGILNPGNIDSGSIVEQHRIKGPGTFDIELVAYSREFRPARAVVTLTLGGAIGDVRLTCKPIRETFPRRNPAPPPSPHPESSPVIPPPEDEREKSK